MWSLFGIVWRKWVTDFLTIKTKNMSHEVFYYEKKENDPTRKFGYAIVSPVGVVVSDPTVVCVFHGIGERGSGSRKDLEKLVSWAGWYLDDNNPSFFGAMSKWPFIVVMVQTDGDFAKGEVDFAAKIAVALNPKKLPVMMGISLGGFGMLNNPPSMVPSKMLFIMPGGNGNAGKGFAKWASEKHVECWFIHAKDDRVALPIQSEKIFDEIIELDGIGPLPLLTMYKSGGHNIAGFPLNSFYPWPMVGVRNPVIDGSYVPSASIFEWFCNGDSIDPVPGEDKLLLVQAIFQRPDGSAYARDIYELVKDMF